MIQNKITLIIATLFLLGVMTGLVSAIEYGSNWDRNCKGDICEVNIYSYEKYWDNNGAWDELNDRFSDCSEEEITKYCSGNYHFKAIADNNGTISTLMDGEEFTLSLLDLLGRNRTFNPSIQDNAVVYTNVVPNIDLKYYYLPTRLKEEIVIKEPLQGLSDREFEITFAKRGNARFHVQDSIICDNRGYCEGIRHEITENGITLTVPIAFLNNENTEYPVTIDPTIEINDSSIYWNGYVTNTTEGGINGYDRTTNPASNLYLSSRPAMPGQTIRARSDIDWNISSIPDSSVIYNLTLSVYPMTSSIPAGNVSLNITAMSGYSDTYADNSTECYGNCQFYQDMADGTLYASGTYPANGVRSIPLGNGALTDFESSLGSDIFSIGLISPTGSDPRVGSRDNTDSTKRPKLTIIYGVNGTDSDAAIAEGISNSVLGGLVSVENDQQIYLLSNAGQHYLGTFDKSIVYKNQTWGFHYVLPEGSFINMPSLFTILNIWENQSLSYNEIVEQVKAYINSTKV